MEEYMRLALLEAKKASKRADVPVGAVIVENNKIIAKAHNQKKYKKNAIRHAEIIAIERACKKKKTWHLDNCTMYVTLEPCMMCTGAIIQAHIKNVVYGAVSDKLGCLENVNEILKNKNINYSINIINNVLSEESSKMIQQFFQNKRK